MREANKDPIIHTQGEIRFGWIWCLLFFIISDDRNNHFHGVFSIRKIVQGVAILTKIGSLISLVLPGYMIFSIAAISFKKSIRIGETVTLTLQNKREIEKRGLATIEVCIHDLKGAVVMPAVELKLFRPR